MSDEPLANKYYYMNSGKGWVQTSKVNVDFIRREMERMPTRVAELRVLTTNEPLAEAAVIGRAGKVTNR